MFLIILIFFYISEVVEQNTIAERLFLLFLFFFLFYEFFMVRRCSFQFLFSSSNYEYCIVKADFCWDGII